MGCAMTNNTQLRSKSLWSVRLFGSASLALVTLGCGATLNTQQDLPPAASVGDEPPPEVEVAEPVHNEESEQKAQHGRLLVNTKFAGKTVPSHVHMLLADGYSFDFESGQDVRAFAGKQQLEVTLADQTLLVDKPTLKLETVVEPDKLTQLDAAFPWAEVRLKLVVRGTEQAATPVKLIRDGHVVAEVLSGEPSFRISPGTYEADVPVRGKTARVKGLVFFEGTAQVVPVRVQR